MKTTVTRKDFKAWLKSKKPSTIVGHPSESTKCPLAKYFQQLNNIKTIEVDVEEVQIFENTYIIKQSAKCKPWMSNFIYFVDLNADKISAKKALDILETC